MYRYVKRFLAKVFSQLFKILTDAIVSAPAVPVRDTTLPEKDRIRILDFPQ